MMASDVLTIVLAGGRGTRLGPLTNDRAKPAVPFGGIYRIIDFALSNCVNSHLRRVMVLTQYKAGSLVRHLTQAWGFLCRELDEFIEVVPAQQRVGESWYEGTADAIYQNIYSIEKIPCRDILILAGDHIYKMNYKSMIDRHRERGADLTVACLPVPREEGREFGVMRVNDSGRVIDFLEKPENPEPMPGHPDQVLASMGIYLFSRNVLFDRLFEDAADRSGQSRHDFGRDIVPKMLTSHFVDSYPFRDENHKTPAYWRDVGTLDAYYAANMDLVAVDPVLNLYDREWPIHTYQPQEPPPKFVHDEPFSGRRGMALNSLVCQGAIISGGQVQGSVISPRVRVNSHALVKDSILLDNVQVGRHAVIKRAVVDKHVRIPPGFTIGLDPWLDRARGMVVTPKGVTIVPKNHDLDRFT